jgi:hypothetical protein
MKLGLITSHHNVAQAKAPVSPAKPNTHKTPSR